MELYAVCLHHSIFYCCKNTLFEIIIKAYTDLSVTGYIWIWQYLPVSGQSDRIPDTDTTLYICFETVFLKGKSIDFTNQSQFIGLWEYYYTWQKLSSIFRVKWAFSINIQNVILEETEMQCFPPNAVFRPFCTSRLHTKSTQRSE